MDKDTRILIVGAGPLEAASQRGGGIEEIDLHIAEVLARECSARIVGPYFGEYRGGIKLSASLGIVQVHFPAMTEYPAPTRHSQYYNVFKGLLYLFPLLASLVRQSRNWKPCALVVHNGTPGLVAAFIAKITRKALVFSEGNTHPWFSPFLSSPQMSIAQRLVLLQDLVLGCLIARMSDRIRVQSNAIRKGMISHRILPSKIEVIPAGVDSNDPVVDASSHASEGLPKVGFIGRLNEEKGASLLLETVQMAAKELPGSRFIILGDGPYRDRLALSSNVEHVGWIPRPELAKWLSKMEIVMFFQKDIGLAELQAMAAGKAIVAGDYEDVSRAVVNMKSGLLCPADAHAYVEAIRVLTCDTELRRTISRHAREEVIKNYAWEVLDTQWISLFKSIC